MSGPLHPLPAIAALESGKFLIGLIFSRPVLHIPFQALRSLLALDFLREAGARSLISGFILFTYLLIWFCTTYHLPAFCLVYATAAPFSLSCNGTSYYSPGVYLPPLCTLFFFLQVRELFPLLSDLQPATP